ncbi:MAG: hypothetical protein ABIA93_00760 [Candidatus Woesearchaeota archaeon]
MSGFKKGLLVGIGLTLLTKDAVTKEMSKQMKKYGLEKKDIEKLSVKALERSRRVHADIESRLKAHEAKLHAEARKMARKARK